MSCKQNTEELGLFCWFFFSLLLREKMRAVTTHRFQVSFSCQSSPLTAIIVAIKKYDKCRMSLSLVDAFQDVN